MQTKEVNEIDNIFLQKGLPGQHFHMDFGFVRVSKYTLKQENGPTITSKDGYNSCLLIVDRATRYMWIFLMSTKHPPVETARKVLNKFKATHPHRTVRTDQGKELGKSEKFREMIDQEGFLLKLTGAEASSQNGIAESPNRVLAQMMRCALYSADLGPEYWSYALRLVVYVKNRLPHSSITNTPYERLTGTRPDISRLRIFGSRVCARMPGADKFPKLDHKNTNGIFLGYTATDKNIYFEDDITGRVLISKHVLFDEAHMSVPHTFTPLGAQALQRTGYSPEDNKDNTKPIMIKLLSEHATTPTASTPNSVGMDLHSASIPEIIISPNGGTASIPTDLSMEPPPGTYVRIAPRSGMAFKHNIHVIGGVIDPDYRGNIKVGLINQSNKPYKINNGDRFAQFITEKAHSPTINIVDNLTVTQRNTKGFGSTETQKYTSPSPPTSQRMKNDATLHYHHNITPENSDDDLSPPSNESNLYPDPIQHQIHNMHTDISAPYHITLSPDPMDNIITVPISLKGTHKTLGLELKTDNDMNRIQLLQCNKGTAAAKIPKWRSTLQQSYIQKYNGVQVKSTDHLEQLILSSRTSKEHTANITFTSIKRQAMHPTYGIPQIYHDQLNIIAQHLTSIKQDIQLQRDVNDSDISKKVMKLTRKKLKELDTWHKWHEAEFTQLDNYQKQDTFGPPCELPPGANVLNLLWTYMYK